MMSIPTYIRKATAADIDDIEGIYTCIHEQESKGKVVIGWQPDVYPTRHTAQDALEHSDLYVLLHNDSVVAAAIINHIQPPGYEQAAWKLPARDEEVLVLHTLAVHPNYEGRGFARSLINYYEDMARDTGCTCLRIDTNARNARARAMYAHLEYTEVSTIPVTFNGIKYVDLVCLEKLL